EIGSVPRQAALSDCGRGIAVVDSDDTIRLWKRENGVGMTLPRRAGAGVTHVTFHPDSSMLAVHYANSPSVLWNHLAETPAERPARGAGGGRTAVSDNGRWMFGSETDSVGQVWNTPTAAAGPSISLCPGMAPAAVSDDGRHIALADARRTLALYTASAQG